MEDHLTPAGTLPADGTRGTLIGRVWLPGDPPGPAVVAVRDEGVFDLGRAAPTVSELEDLRDIAAKAGKSLFTAWHAQHNDGVDAAAKALSGQAIKRLRITWKEDVRQWHPGQEWIWQAGG